MINIKELERAILILRLKIAVALFKQKRTIPNDKEIKGAVVHHGGGDLDFMGVNTLHKDNWGFKSSLGYYVGYHKFISFDGVLHIARRDDERGAHAVGDIPYYYNDYYVGICLQGNTENTEPTVEQIITLRMELDKFRKAGLEILDHSQVSATLCPGKKLKKWLVSYLEV